MSVVRVNGDLLAGDTATDAHDRVARSDERRAAA